MSLPQIPEDDVVPFYLDLEDHASIAQATTSILEIFGHVDILINNAGIGCSSPVERMKLETYKKVMDINYFGQVELTRSKFQLKIYANILDRNIFLRWKVLAKTCLESVFF